MQGVSLAVAGSAGTAFSTSLEVKLSDLISHQGSFHKDFMTVNELLNTSSTSSVLCPISLFPFVWSKRIPLLMLYVFLPLHWEAPKGLIYTASQYNQIELTGLWAQFT